MPGSTTYGVELLVELAIGRASDAGHWGQADWGETRWGHTDTTLGDWVDVTCDVLDDVRLTAGSNTSDGVTRRWESASAAFTLDGPQWDPWNGPHADVIGDRTPVRMSWRYPPDPPPVVLTRNLDVNPRAVSATNWVFSAGTGAATTVGVTGAVDGPTANGQMIGSYRRSTVTTGSTSAGPVHYADRAGVAGDQATLGMWMRSSTAWTITAAALRFLNINTNVGAAPVTVPIAVPANTWIWVPGTATATAAYTRTYVFLAGVTTAGQVIDWTAGLSTNTPTAGGYFDGSTPDTTERDYAWASAVNLSASTVSTIQHHTGTWTPTFTGYIATRGYAWNPAEQEAGVACVDGTSVLVASDRVPSPVAGAGETAAARVQRIAAAALWPGALDVTAGGTALQGTTLDAPSWEELLAVADTDLALLWITRAGALAYRPRGRVGLGTVPAGRLVVCPDAAGDVQVMNLGRNQPTVTRNRVEIARRKDESIPGDEPVIARAQDDQSVARYQAHDFKRTDLWHIDDAWSATIAAAILGAGTVPSPAPGELALDTITGDPKVPALLLTAEPDMTFTVVDDGGRSYVQAVVGWDMSVGYDGIEAVLHVEDVSRWMTDTAHWGTALWGTDRWGIGGN